MYFQDLDVPFAAVLKAEILNSINKNSFKWIGLSFFSKLNSKYNLAVWILEILDNIYQQDEEAFSGSIASTKKGYISIGGQEAWDALVSTRKQWKKLRFTGRACSFKIIIA